MLRIQPSMHDVTHKGVMKITIQNFTVEGKKKSPTLYKGSIVSLNEALQTERRVSGLENNLKPQTHHYWGNAMDWNQTPRKKHSSMFGNWVSPFVLCSLKPSKGACIPRLGLWKAHWWKVPVRHPKSPGIIQKSLLGARIPLINKYIVPTLQQQTICLSSATFTRAEDKASRSRNHLHCHPIVEQRKKQQRKNQILSLSISFFYLHHYLHLAGVITGHKYHAVSF